MTLAGEWLRAAERDLPLAARLDALLGAAPGGGALVLAPHPDDESLGCGGLIAACAAEGRPVRVVVVSDGPHRIRAPAPGRPRALPRCGRRRRGRQWRRWGSIPRATSPSSACRTARCRRRGRGSRRRWRLSSAWRCRRPAAVFASLAARPALRPRRHRRAGVRRGPAAAVRDTRLFAYPVWGLAFAHPIPGFPLPTEPVWPAPPRGVRLDTAGHLPAKRRAVAAHASQITGLIADSPAGFRLPPEALALAFRPFEMFLEETAG